jgi:multiple sugar transport system permease protein
VTLVIIWKNLGYLIIIILAGLQGIPETLYEAARIDGASNWSTFRYISVPLLRPTIVFMLVTGLISSFQVFTPMYVMTKGGPIDYTRTMVYLLYDKAFVSFRFGYASSLAVLLFFLVLALTMVQTRLLRVGQIS